MTPSDPEWKNLTPTQKATFQTRRWRAANPEKRALQTKRYVARHPEAIRARDARYIKKRMDWYNSLKEGKPCADCAQVFPTYVMDFDHKDPASKSFSISAIRRNRQKHVVLAEIEKCDIVCANCHRIRTHNRTHIWQIRAR